jgi:hypothetical protein
MMVCQQASKRWYLPTIVFVGVVVSGWPSFSVAHSRRELIQYARNRCSLRSVYLL